jgi:hypothetical protein
VGSLALRCALIVVALLAGAWLAAGLRVSALEDEGNTAFERARNESLGRAEITQARDALHSADALTSDSAPQLIEGRLLAALGHNDEAVALAIQVVAKEPENVDAWYLAHVSTKSPEGLALTRRRVQQLNPLLGDQLE